AAHARPRRQRHHRAGDGRGVPPIEEPLVSCRKAWAVHAPIKGDKLMKRILSTLALALLAPAALAQACPDRNVLYWQAFPPGGESDLSARHQQVVLKKKCPAV